MELTDREQMTVYWACRRALERMEQLENRKAGEPFRATLALEAADYAQIANRIAEELKLEKVDE